MQVDFGRTLLRAVVATATTATSPQATRAAPIQYSPLPNLLRPEMPSNRRSHPPRSWATPHFGSPTSVPPSRHHAGRESPAAHAQLAIKGESYGNRYSPNDGQ